MLSWKSLIGVLVALFFGSLAAAPVFAPAFQNGIDLRLGVQGHSEQKFGMLSAGEINRRTLKAAAAIKAARR